VPEECCVLTAGIDKRALSERDICTKYITPALRHVGWDEMLQIREEVGFTKGRIIVRGKLVTRGQAKRANYILYYKPNIPLALIEARSRVTRLPPRADICTAAAHVRYGPICDMPSFQPAE